MYDWLLELVRSLPAPLAVMFLAFQPLGEMRVSIPVGVLHYGMGWAESLVWSILGALLIAPVALWIFPRLEILFNKWGPTRRLLAWVFERTRTKGEAKVARWKEGVVLLSIILVPLPGAGAWTAALIAHVFGLDWRVWARDFYAGVVIACITMTVLVETGRWVF